MSSIPVRKGIAVHQKRKNKGEGHSPPHEEIEKKDTKPRSRFHSKEDNGKHRPLTRKELAEENDAIKSEVKDYESRLKELETLLRIEKDKAASMKKESSKMEAEYKENLDSLNKKSEVLESRLVTYEEKLLKCNIDPVTLDSLEPGSKDSDSETRYEQARVKVKLIKEKFREFNHQALQNIDSLQLMNTQLDCVITNCESVTNQDDNNCLDTSDVYY